VVVYDLVTLASSQARRRLMKSWMTRNQRRLRALKPELMQVRRLHAGDSSAQRRASREVFARHGVRPAYSCAPPLLGLAITQAPVLWSPLNQTVAECLAGAVVVRD
jgi:membrane protein insertase Oxa1/YidC/SpoIIIJ